ncbi:MAG: glycerol-3-phosphate dehydrogenase [Azospirillum sp.]|nr:glycerol-3-phosphate dehydrogenase [Azospirillum sp.]
MQGKPFDLAIIGGGVNGCGIARDAAGRGLSVFLCEQDDLASGTSSASTKLVHGGLRYLEYFEFRLVRESLAEREVLLRAAPHIVRPLRFVLPHQAGMRPAWFIRLGLFVYDHLGNRHLLPGTTTVDLTRDPAGAPLRGDLRRAFEYSDCWVEDSRLVVLTAVDAAARGAEIRPRTECLAAERAAGLWRLKVRDRRSGGAETIAARVLVNAAGPWAARFLAERAHLDEQIQIRLVKGSHIVVPRLFDHDRAYIFQNRDGRVVFAIPYEQRFTLIGTTDVDYQGDPAQVAISPEETSYLCAAAGAYFRAAITPETVVHSYSGVRPLVDDGTKDAKAATRDYVLELDTPADGAPLLNVFGGKITTYRILAETVLAKLRPFFPAMTKPWTAGAPLPGGNFPVDGVDGLIGVLRDRAPALTADHARRLVRAYGTNAPTVAGGAKTLDDLGEHFGADLYGREVDYLMAQEWAVSADDVLWRRSKLGLHVTPDDAERLGAWMRRRAGTAGG